MWLPSLPFLVVVAVPALAGEPKPTRIAWRFEKIIEGYDHLHQMVIAADGAEVATSEPGKESVVGSMSVVLPKDAKTLRIVSMAFYEDTWEEHTVANDYGVDCLWEIDVPARPPRKIDLVCDIDEGPTSRVR